jgi:hypothetical protein
MIQIAKTGQKFAGQSFREPIAAHCSQSEASECLISLTLPSKAFGGSNRMLERFG